MRRQQCLPADPLEQSARRHPQLYREGWASAASSKYKVGANTLGKLGYDGPCPRVGKEGPHKYGISVTATSLEPGALKPGMRIGEVFDAVGKYLLNSNGIEVVYPAPAK